MSWVTKMQSAREATGVLSFDGEDAFRGDYPNLADLLTGCEGSGSMGALPPFKLTLFVREGRLRFSCSSPDFDLWGVGEVASPADGLAGVEEMLAQGRVSWKQEKPPSGGKTGK